MKVLMHIFNESEGTKLICCDTNTSKMKDYTVKELLQLKENEPSLLVEGIIFNGTSVEVENPNLYEGDSIYIVAMLAESGKEKKRVVGYKVYDPKQKKMVCLPVNLAVERAEKDGVINGDIRTSGTRTYLYAKVKTEPANKHVNLYLQMYHYRKRRANEANRPCEKIVRVDKNHLELRGIPTGSYDRMVTPKGIAFINLKWWKIVGPKHMLFQDKPKVKELVLGDSVTKILYNKPENDMNLVPKEVSLGAFANWGLNKVTLSPLLNVIGQEAFNGNNITEITIPSYVWEIGESAFKNAGLKSLKFDRRTPDKKGKVMDITIKDNAFAGNPLDNTYYLQLPKVKAIGRNAFKGCKISSVNFAKNSTIKYLKTGSFANTDIEEFWVPDSVEVIEEGVFSGSPIKKLIFSKSSKIRMIHRNFAGKATVRIIGTRVVPK